MTYEQLGEMDALLVDELYDEHQLRAALDRLEQDHRSLVAALHANGNMDGQSMKKAIEELTFSFEQNREEIIYRSEHGGAAETELEEEQWW